MKSILKSGLSIVAIAVLTLSSCKKEKETDNDTGSATDNNLAENLFGQVKSITDAAADGTMKIGRAHV